MGETDATVTGDFYRATGITHDELVQVVKDAPGDAAVGAWLRSQLDDETIAKWNERYYHSTIGDIKGALRERMFLAHSGAEWLPETTTLADLFDADDAAMFGVRFRLFSNDFDEGRTLPMKQVLALALWQNTERAVLSVAFAVGYDSASRFASRFRSRFGYLPSDIRGQKRGTRSSSSLAKSQLCQLTSVIENLTLACQEFPTVTAR